MTTDSTTERVFTALDHIDPAATKTLKSVFRDEDLTAIVEWINPGETFEDPHSHPESAHVFVVVSGEGDALVGHGKWEKTKPGDFVVNPRHKVHAMRNTSTSERFVWVCVHITNGPHVTDERTEDDE